MKNATKSSFFKKEELETILSRDERFGKLKPERREIVLDVLSNGDVEKVFDLKNPELNIVMDVRGY